jgi:non-homologous end joining protein Ku
MADLSNYDIKYKFIPRPWGQEIRFNCVNKKTGNIIQDNCLCKDEKQWESVLSNFIDRYEATKIEMVEVKEDPEILTDKKVESYLIEKGYLKSGDTLSVLTVKA